MPMSVMRCSECDRFIDTDFDVEGLWGIDGETPNGEDFICGSCCDRLGLYEDADGLGNRAQAGQVHRPRG